MLYALFALESKTKRLNERRSDGGLSRGLTDPDCGRVTGRSGPWETLSEKASHGLESGAIARAIAACLARLHNFAHEAQHTWNVVSVKESPEGKAHRNPLRKLMRLLIIHQPSWLPLILSLRGSPDIQTTNKGQPHSLPISNS
jgi:hypothetical protein